VVRATISACAESLPFQPTVDYQMWLSPFCVNSDPPGVDVRLVWCYGTLFRPGRTDHLVPQATQNSIQGMAAVND
jgi:hypothetical protein